MIINSENKKNKGLKLFLLGFLITSFFSISINGLGKNMKDYFFFREITRNPGIFMAQVNVNLESITKERQKEEAEIKLPEIPKLEIMAKSAISVLVNSDIKEEKTIFEKDSNMILPIASLTKLIVADVVLENYDLNRIIRISQNAVAQEGDMGYLKVGEEFTVENLLYIMLIESSNDAAYSLSEVLTPNVFVRLMNLEAQYLGMTNTYFEDPMGISARNQSNTKDLVILIKHLIEEQPLIWEILKKPEFVLKFPDGVLHHKLVNTNEILREWGSNLEIVGGKTGYTYQANGCFALVLKVTDNGYLINVILGSDDRFGEMKKIIDFYTENF
jgi:D-alanyl-D-alanine carboxypeptidase